MQNKTMQDANLRRMALLREMPLFADLAEKDLQVIVDDLRVRDYAKDAIIFRQDDESREVYFVRKGKVRIFKISPSGNETSIAIFSNNDVIGELAAIDQEPRSATAKAVTPVTLLAMSQERFLLTLQTVPRFALNLAKLLSRKLRWTAAYAESIAQFDAAGRLLHIILIQNDAYGEVVTPGLRSVVNLGLNQSDLASMVGARREWINRILSEWRRRGLLEFDNGVITILDLPRVVAERDSRIEANQSTTDW
ncbi:MAG: Crp/Fnr family transcriptional regulator [Anaerolineales bacterium]|nr:Crp/Fnr family transcriptional regulator [Anaerolineales bacterium]